MAFVLCNDAELNKKGRIGDPGELAFWNMQRRRDHGQRESWSGSPPGRQSGPLIRSGSG